MPFTLGDLILIELSLVRDMKDLDLSMQAGQQYIEIIGRVEQAISQLRAAAQQQGGQELLPVSGKGGD